MDHRHYKRHENRSHKVYQHRVRGYTGYISSELSCNHCSSSRCRTNQTQHRTFYQHHLVVKVSRQTLHHPQREETKPCKCEALDKKEPPVPPVRLEILRFDPAEGKEQHGENQQGLHEMYNPAEKRSGTMKRLGQDMV